MGITKRISVLALGLVTVLNAPLVCADADGLSGMNAANPASFRISATNLAGLDTLGINAAELLGMDTGGGTGSMDPGGSSGTSDPLLKLKLDDDPDHVGRKIGHGRLLPDVSVESGYNDNLTLESTKALGTFYTKIKPHSAYVMSDGTRKLALDLLLDAGYFEASSKDNYLDERLRANFDYNPTSRIFASAFAEFLNSHDARGTGRAQGGAGITQASLDEWHQWGLGGKFAYGAPTARGRLEFETGYLLKQYDSNRIFTFTRDREDIFGAARFFYRIRPKTALVFEAQTTEHNYLEDAVGLPSLNGITTNFLTGVTWQATYKTAGFAKIGYNFRTFDAAQRATQSGLSWDVGVDWKPKSYSTVHLETSSTIAETNGTGDAVNQNNILLSWKYYWRDRFSTTLDLGYQNSTFAPDPRKDNSYQLGVRADYALRRWLNVGGGFRHQMLDSTDKLFNYDQNIIELSLGLTF